MTTLGTTRQLVALPPAIQNRLQEVRRRDSRLRLLTGLVDALALFLVLVLTALLLDWAFTLFDTTGRQIVTYSTLVAGGLGLVVLAAIPLLKRRSLADVAADIDRSVISLEERWQTVTELSASEDGPRVIGSRTMIDQVMTEAVARNDLVNVHDVVPADRLKKHQWFLALAIGAQLTLFLVDSTLAWDLMQRFWTPTVAHSLTQIDAVSGDMVVARGEPIRLEADAKRRPRDTAVLFMTEPGSDTTNIQTLSAATADGAARFTYLIDAAKTSFSYKFRSGDGETALHNVEVYDRPSLADVSFRITPPDYTRMGVIEKNELPGRIRAIAGSVLEIAFTADQPLENFQLDFGKNELLSLHAEPGTEANRYVYHATLTETVRFVPRMKSMHNLENTRPSSCQVTVYADQPPKVRINSPDDEMAVRPDDKVVIEWNGRDDFGVKEAELIVYTGDAADLENAQVLPFESGETPAQPQTTDKPSTADQTTDDAAPQKPADADAPADAKPAAEAALEKPEKSEANLNVESADSKQQTPDGKTAPTRDFETTSRRRKAGVAERSQSPAENPKAQQQNGTKTPPKSNPAANPSKQDPNTKANSANAPASKAADNKNTNGDNNQAAAPANRTFRMPLDLGDKAGTKNIDAKVLLDLSKLNLKNGEQLQYMVRIKDSRNSESQGQTHSNRQPETPTTGPTAQTTPGDPPSSPSDKTTDKDRNQQSAQSAEAANRAKTDPKNANSKSANGGNDQASKMQADGAKASPSNNANKAAPNGDPSKLRTTDGNTANTTPADAAKMQANAATNASQSNNNNGNKTANDGASKMRANDAKAVNSSANSAQTANGNPQNPADNSQQANAQNGGGGQNSQPQQNASKSVQQTPQDPQNSSGGNSPPPNDMTMQELDVDQSQASASSTMRLQIDEFAGSFEGQKRQKLEVKIDPVLKQLDEALAKTQEHLAPVGDALKQKKPLDDDLNKSIRAGQRRLEQSQSLVADLVKTTDGTVYAFIGLQLVDITELHITPALTELQAVAKEAAEKQSAHVEQAQFHVTRARELLADLTKKYETAKSDAKLADNLDRIQRMYQTFLEDTMTMLRSAEPGRNSRDRKMAQLELDEEFLQQYNELQKEFQKVLAELAEALADDPRLLERYMNLSRRSSQNLRDQLTIIHERQQALVPLVDRLANGGDAPGNAAKAEAEPKDAAPADASLKDAGRGDKQVADKAEKPVTMRELVTATLARDLDAIVDRANEEQENLKTWLPTGIDPQDKRIAPLREQSTQVAITAALATAALARQDGGVAVTQDVTELGEKLKALETTMTGMVNGDNPALDAHINRRLAKVRQMELLTSAWLDKNEQMKAGRYNRALELDQHKLAEDTLDFVGKLDAQDAQLAGYPDDILAISSELKEILRFDVLTDQMSAELSLRDNELPAAQEQQKTALADLARAEAQFDKLFDRMIEEDDKIPPNVPDIDNMQLQTLEDLLAQLQNETDLAELLGLPDRPMNLQTLTALLNQLGGSGGFGLISGPQQGMNRVNQARRNARRAIQNANDVKRAQRPGPERRRWNTLASELDDDVRQGRGNMPPKQYRRAIERYFELISGAEGSESAPATSEKKDIQKEEAVPHQGTSADSK